MRKISEASAQRLSAVGYFSPEDISFLDQILDEAMREAVASSATRVFDSNELRASLAASIMTSAGAGDREPARLKALALEAVEALATPKAAGVGSSCG